MNLKALYDMDYLSLKDYILYNNKQLKVLKDKKLKEKLINSVSFSLFMKQASDDIMINLLDEEGIEILKNSIFFNNSINEILGHHLSFVDELSKIPSFCDVVISQLKNAYFVFKISNESAIRIVEYAIDKIDIKTLDELIFHLEPQAQYEVVKNISLPYNIILKLITSNKDIAEYVFNCDIRFTSLDDLSYEDIYSIFNKGTIVPNFLLNEEKFFSKLISIDKVREYRALVDGLNENNDISGIEKAREIYYDKQLQDYSDEWGLLTKYYNCFKEICDKLDEDPNNYLDEILNKNLNSFCFEYHRKQLKSKLLKLCQDQDDGAIYSVLRQESNFEITDMIIDYHFKQLPYNFFLDLKQLCEFQNTEGKTLSDEDIEIYNKILNLDNIYYDEKIKLHQILKKSNMMEKFYDAIKSAKEKQIQLIKKSMLNKQTIQKYKDEELSKEKGVDIYVLDGDDFYIFVKALLKQKYRAMQPSDIYYNVDGCSYSLDCSKKLNTYKNPHEYYHIAFSDFPEDQVVHVFPADSYSYYERGSGRATDRVYTLNTPEQLTSKSNFFDEIVLLQRNDDRNDEINSQLKVPEMFAIYCYDEITKNDIESAKNLGLGIVLVKTYAYGQRNNVNQEDDIYIKSVSKSTIYNAGLKYLDGLYGDDMAVRRKGM